MFTNRFKRYKEEVFSVTDAELEPMSSKTTWNKNKKKKKITIGVMGPSRFMKNNFLISCCFNQVQTMHIYVFRFIMINSRRKVITFESVCEYELHILLHFSKFFYPHLIFKLYLYKLPNKHICSH